MSSPTGIREGQREGFETVTLLGRDGVEATWAPGANMVLCSLRQHGEELLAQRSGLCAYAERGATMGVPLLYPWANRLARWGYGVAGQDVSLDPDSPLMKADPSGLPIHGVRAGALRWEGAMTRAAGDQLALTARLDWGSHGDLMTVFPFDHEIVYEALLGDRTLTVTTTVHAGATSLPVSFGYHPYLCLPGPDRQRCRITIPARERLDLDARMIPTGARTAVGDDECELGESSFDDAFAALPQPAVFAVRAGRRQITVRLGEGYEFAQVYGPASERFICFEPMTAPTNALVTTADLRVLSPGESHSATFELGLEGPVPSRGQNG